MKFCLGCQRQLPLTEFYTRTVGGKQYPQSRCKPCYCKNRKVTCGWKPKSAAAMKRQRLIDYRKERAHIINGSIFHCAKSFYHCHKKHDKKRGREFDLEIEWICERILEPCVYCGESVSRRTLDRIDNALGHLKSNVVVACVSCNLIRGNMPYVAWLALVPAVRAAREAGLFGDWEPRRLMRHTDTART